MILTPWKIFSKGLKYLWNFNIFHKNVTCNLLKWIPNRNRSGTNFFAKKLFLFEIFICDHCMERKKRFKADVSKADWPVVSGLPGARRAAASAPGRLALKATELCTGSTESQPARGNGSICARREYSPSDKLHRRCYICAFLLRLSPKTFQQLHKIRNCQRLAPLKKLTLLTWKTK